MAVRSSGFTLIELMVTLAVLAVLAVAAVPSFLELRQRSALRGSVDQVITFWGNARFEALKRNVPIKVGFRTDNTLGMCIGASSADVGNNAPCDCFTTGACDVASYPAAQSDWRGSSFAAASTLGDPDSGVAVVDPKRGGLTNRADAGRISLKGPSGSRDYRLDIVIDGNGRAVQCEPSMAPAKIPGYGDRQC